MTSLACEKKKLHHCQSFFVSLSKTREKKNLTIRLEIHPIKEDFLWVFTYKSSFVRIVFQLIHFSCSLLNTTPAKKKQEKLGCLPFRLKLCTFATAPHLTSEIASWAPFTQDAKHLATTPCKLWNTTVNERSHSLQATSKDLHGKCVSASCVNWALKCPK